MPVLANENARIESCDLQLGDTWRGMQSKMSVAAPVKKQRKKSENKPQSQINKCHNEKKRRELENETINQLEELLGTCLAEVKQPDKNGIVREATRQIQDVLQRRRECPGECPLRAAQCLSPVQAGEVSSTQPQLLNVGHQYSELTTLIEALKHYTTSLGWVLLEINAKGEIECVTENIKEFTLQDRTELYKKPIFSCLHVNDHAKLRPLLRNIQKFAWGSGEVDRFHAIPVRLLVKNTNGTEGASYVESVIHAAPVRGPSSEEAGSVMCVIRRFEDASAALLPDDGGPPAIAAKPSDHIVFRLDSNYTILSCDLSAVENNLNSPVSIVGTRYLELVESGDRLRVVGHLREAQCYPAPPAVTDPFRIRIAADRPWLRVTARSRLFRAKPTSGDPDFIMSTHTVLGDEELDLLEAENPRPTVGGPLMTSVANGESSACDPRYRSSISPAEPPPFSINDFDLEPWTSSFPLSDMSTDDSKERKDNTTEGRSTPLTPRAPSTPGDGPIAGASNEEPNRLRLLLSKKPTPGEGATNTNNRILKDLLRQEDEEATGSETSAPHTPLTPHTPHTPHTPAAALSPLHPAQMHPRPPHSAHNAHGAHNAHNAHVAHNVQHAAHNAHNMQQQQHSHNSDVLLRILNDKTDEDARERRNSGDGGRSSSQPSALLSQLLSSSNGPSGNGRSHDGSEGYMERIAGVKRKLDEVKVTVNNVKRATPENQQVTSSAVSIASSSSSSSTATCPATSMSALCQKNQILVSLLARQQTTPTTPPPLPNPNLRAYTASVRPRPPPPTHQMQTPRHHHSTITNILADAAHRVNNLNGGSGPGGGGGGGGSGGECPSMHGAQSHLQMVLQGGARAAYGSQPAPPLHYATTAPHHPYNNQPPSSSNRAQGGTGAGDSEVPSDQTLSDILDEVIENMPDADRNAPESVKEKTAMINEIRKSLMQCETVSKSPVSSPGTPPVYPVQSPGSCNMGGSSAGGKSGAPSAMYGAAEAARARALAEQHNRLLQMQLTQQMLVSPEAAEQPQQDLGSTINALVSGTPPNVALTRTDYQRLYHPTNQMGSNYGSNKITTSQQNPMLSRQLSGSGSSGYSHSVAMASVHTPMTPQYHRAQRPQLVGGYYEDGGYCGEYARRTPLPHAHAHAHPTHDTQLPCAGNGGGVVGAGGSGGGGTSEYVRNELRAVVGARSARPDLQPQLQPPDLDQLMTFDMSTAGEYCSVYRFLSLKFIKSNF
ncbi:unnamed protein product [Diatraea saccharalis]|uniref:BHLH domain-containing protein n=1 Tax=Diatraea saccharalis TaxID=40085 RepID=A0A9P0C6D0_9NEOP|nr:unnamed protein product [Diatraea saccharalis]